MISGLSRKWSFMIMTPDGLGPRIHFNPLALKHHLFPLTGKKHLREGTLLVLKGGKYNDHSPTGSTFIRGCSNAVKWLTFSDATNARWGIIWPNYNISPT